jgi:aspartate racemase
MKKIGIIGGITWKSTLEYYRIINNYMNIKLGGSHSADCILYSFDFSEIERLQIKIDWVKLTNLTIDAAKTLETAGADFIIICANTMHKTADQIQDNIKIPILNIIDVTAEKIIEEKMKIVGLLGTKYTMEEDFYKNRMKEKFNIDIIIPDKNEREIINNIIYKELSSGKIKSDSKEDLIKIINKLIRNKAGGIILGCTEIPLLINQNDLNHKIFNTTLIHAKAAVEYALR